MAQINANKFVRIEKQRNNIHEIVSSTYTVFEGNDKKYLQIDTYGKQDREMPEKVSQSFQVDEETARFLINLLIAVFALDNDYHI
ncbi:MAG: methionyl-tRNA formyltransferase [Clostridiales bacterium]|jgi:hypothetical protein|nr:methionyl-tRNA formyltransferase [Clostridiales bacterium]